MGLRPFLDRQIFGIPWCFGRPLEWGFKDVRQRANFLHHRSQKKRDFQKNQNWVVILKKMVVFPAVKMNGEVVIIKKPMVKMVDPMHGIF